ncbi:PREDICTED: uncharacterized protein LOC109355124 isoform X2 [Lupinus angustifolius]|uniref:uncharacterized protein LOC109355124 isoform X2 n=1 Tax=Lupinus angustifolius TaxID=3871 RepID=UPI00092FC151|nr:PREDICTED: uncharacterized protein LOC109355124 isoform X2 [Lupinus angustifolius]
MMKKMKGVALSMEPSYDVYQDQRARLRHQSLFQDYEDIHKETEAMRRKLQAAKQKRLILSDEVRFLRQRYIYLLQNPSPKPQAKQLVPKPQKLKIQASYTSKGRNYKRKESTLRVHNSSPLKPKEMIFNGAEVAMRRTGVMFDLNQNGWNFNKKDAFLHSSAPVLDLNHEDRNHSGKEATKKIGLCIYFVPLQREEEELLSNTEATRIEEPKRNTRVASDEQHNDIKLLVCRNIGDGSNRTGKRKISWQDQVALRV